MNPVPFVIAGATVALVPPLRRRVVPVATAAATGTVGLGLAVVVGAVAFASAAVDGVVDLADAVVRGPAEG